jgi:hypothetical protein
MNECALPAGITALACAIAQQFEDDYELALFAAALLQLSDTLSTIVSQRALASKK